MSRYLCTSAGHEPRLAITETIEEGAALYAAWADAQSPTGAPTNRVVFVLDLNNTRSDVVPVHVTFRMRPRYSGQLVDDLTPPVDAAERLEALRFSIREHPVCLPEQ